MPRQGVVTLRCAFGALVVTGAHYRAGLFTRQERQPEIERHVATPSISKTLIGGRRVCWYSRRRPFWEETSSSCCELESHTMHALLAIDPFLLAAVILGAVAFRG